jgi:hypothetical protein
MSERGWRIVFAVVLLATLGRASSASAAPLADDNEIQGSFFFSMGNSGNHGLVGTNAQYGRYFVPWFELGLRQQFDYIFRDRGSDPWIASTEPFIDLLYNVDPHQVAVPYIGCGLGAAYNENRKVGVVDPEAGVKFFMNDQTYVGFAYNYQFFFNDVDNNFHHGQNQVKGQIGFLWGADRMSEVRVAAKRVEDAAVATQAAAAKVDAAASQVQNAAGKIDSAASDMEKAADGIESNFKRGLLK